MEVADGLHVGAEFLAALGTYAQAADEAVEEAVTHAMTSLQEHMRDQARQHPRWHEIADHIEVWADDGRLWVGVSNEEFISEAMAAEYGDEHHPPAPLLRTGTRRGAEMAGQEMDRYLRSTGVAS